MLNLEPPSAFPTKSALKVFQQYNALFLLVKLQHVLEFQRLYVLIISAEVATSSIISTEERSANEAAFQEVRFFEI